MNMDLFWQNMQDGLMLAILGMGVVMIFLTLMMWVMKLNDVVMLKLNEIFPEDVNEEPKKVQPVKTEDEIAIAVACATKLRPLIKGGR